MEEDHRRERPSDRPGGLAELNEEIRLAVLKLDAAEPELWWEFHCECGAPGCEAMVALPLAEFDLLKLAQKPVLAAGHTVSRAALARRMSARLGADASALGGQASQQRRRARKNLRARVLVVDDNDSMRTTAAAVVSTAETLRVVGSAASGEEAIQQLPELKPDFVLLDVRMPGIDGIEVAHAIRRHDPNILVVLYSADPTALDRARRSVEGAAFLDKADLRPHTLDALWAENRPRGRP